MAENREDLKDSVWMEGSREERKAGDKEGGVGMGATWGTSHGVGAASLHLHHHRG